MNVRELTNLDPNYYEINREERNKAAVLYSALCIPGNAEQFLRFLNFPGPVGPEFGIYYEYAYLRDLWHIFKKDDAKKRQVLRNLLPIKEIDNIVQGTAEEINRQFGVSSSKTIENPGNWPIRNFHIKFPDDGDLLKVCKFKWSFKIKPDIVIHIDKDTAICIEAKDESNEGTYPSRSQKEDRNIFKARSLPYVGQTELQKYMMEELLGIKTTFVMLASKNHGSPTHKFVSWKEAFGSVDMTNMPVFAKEMAARMSK